MNFSNEIISWYLKNKRNLPWRDTSDPYVIWLSEVILQQTRVEQGLPYFHRFKEQFPTVSEFASASEDEILRLWQGLGYYSRGRNMHYTANVVMEEHAGYFPSTYDKLIKLKGIGEYTAAAIASFAGNEPRAVVDGNVFRLLSRYFGIDMPINSSRGKKLFSDLANQIMDKDQPGLYNQGIMEFGSLQCKPVHPLCDTCPLRLSCEAFRQDRINELPVKIKSQKSRKRFFNYILAVKEGRVLVNKRGPNDIWQNLYELPLFESESELKPHQVITMPEFLRSFGAVNIRSVTGPVKHTLSHQKLIAQFIEIGNFSESFTSDGKDWKFVSYDDIERLAQPKLIFAFLKNISKFS